MCRMASVSILFDLDGILRPRSIGTKTKLRNQPES